MHGCLHKTPEKVLNRFWAKVDILDGFVTDEDCWLWVGSKNTKGYGNFQFRSRVRPAHKVSFMLYKGDVPNALSVLHTCDCPSCINPSHLFLGTQQDNVKDRDKKGRRRNHNELKTHCKHGHKFTSKNTYIDHENFRHCKICRSQN